jgi:hypothetical protein
MTNPVNFPQLGLALSLAALLLAASGCGSTNTPRDLMMEEATKGGDERPVAMRGESTFMEGKLAVYATVTRGFSRGADANRNQKKGQSLAPDDGRKKDDVGAFSEVYNFGGRGDSEEEQKEAMADYLRQARARRAAGSPMPPVTLKVAFENKGTEPVEIEITEVNSILGNFAVRPPKLSLAAGGNGVLEPMISQLGVTSDEIPLTVVIRQGGKREQQRILVKNVILDSVRKQAEEAQKQQPAPAK